MELVITNKIKFKIFSNVFRYLPVFMDTVNINVTDKGIYMQGMDTSQVCLFELKLNPEWFDTFERDKNYVLGLHCTTFYKVIQCIEDVEQMADIQQSLTNILGVHEEHIQSIETNISKIIFNI